MNNVALVALFGWVPFVMGLFLALPPRRAVIAAFVGAWLFLPMAGVKLAEGIPLYDKMAATCVGVFLGMLVFDLRRLQTYRAGLIDLPMLIWCLCPMASSLSNDLGMYDGTSAVFRQAIMWGLPYYIGRLYFSDLTGLKELAIGMFIGGLIYVPLCLFEIRMSPRLHAIAYGRQLNNWTQVMRYDGWRPIVFMQHGLMVGMWMCMTGLIGFWLWHCKVLPKTLCRMPTGVWVLTLLGTAVLCKSVGAIVLLGLGVGGLLAVLILRTKWVIWGLVIVSPLYMVVRAGGMWDASQLLQVSSDVAGEERAGSLEFRIRNEDMLSAKAMQQPIFGWGGWGRARVYDESGRDISATDGLWIIALGNNGVVGLASLTLAMLLPVGLLLRRYPIRAWRESNVSPAIVLAVIVALYVIDSIPNGMVNPIFMLAAGGIGLCGASTPGSAGCLGRKMADVPARTRSKI